MIVSDILYTRLRSLHFTHIQIVIEIWEIAVTMMSFIRILSLLQRKCWEYLCQGVLWRFIVCRFRLWKSVTDISVWKILGEIWLGFSKKSDLSFTEKSRYGKILLLKCKEQKHLDYCTSRLKRIQQEQGWDCLIT